MQTTHSEAPIASPPSDLLLLAVLMEASEVMVVVDVVGTISGSADRDV